MRSKRKNRNRGERTGLIDRSGLASVFTDEITGLDLGLSPFGEDKGARNVVSDLLDDGFSNYIFVPEDI
jgi:hypothetical protein